MPKRKPIVQKVRTPVTTPKPRPRRVQSDIILPPSCWLAAPDGCWYHPTGIKLWNDYGERRWAFRTLGNDIPQTRRVKLDVDDACELALACLEGDMLATQVIVIPLILDKWRLMDCDEGVARNTYDYDTPEGVLAAYRTTRIGGPEPDGWFRHHQTCRRRPGGDAAKEYIRR